MYRYIPTCIVNVLDTMDCCEKGRQYVQSSQWALVLWSKTGKILFGPVNSNFHFKDWYKYVWHYNGPIPIKIMAKILFDFQNRIVLGIAIVELVHCLTLTCTNVTLDHHRSERCDCSGSLELWCLTPLSTIFQLETRDPSNSFRCVLYSLFSVGTIQNFEFLQW